MAMTNREKCIKHCRAEAQRYRSAIARSKLERGCDKFVETWVELAEIYESIEAVLEGVNDGH